MSTMKNLRNLFRDSTAVRANKYKATTWDLSLVDLTARQVKKIAETLELGEREGYQSFQGLKSGGGLNG